jgi:uncharacterized protein DUF6364
MDAKLTLSVDKNIIKKAKKYAKMHNVSLSWLIESYLTLLTQKKKSDIELTPLVESLSGVISLADDFDYKNEYSSFLVDKYK